VLLDPGDRHKPVTVCRILDVREICNLLTRQKFACRTYISLGQEVEGLTFDQSMRDYYLCANHGSKHYQAALLVIIETDEALERAASSLDADGHLLDFESASKK
jgi:hypothetical protein